MAGKAIAIKFNFLTVFRFSPNDVEAASQFDATDFICITGLQLPQDSNLAKPQHRLVTLCVWLDDSTKLGEEVGLWVFHKSCRDEFRHAAFLRRFGWSWRCDGLSAGNDECETGVKTDVRK